MPTPYFDFKQFRVYHDKSGLPVTTEACLFGAIIGQHFYAGPSSFSALDIGAGSGLLSLMVAQECMGADIDAVEIFSEAAVQAGENIQISPWQRRVKVYNQSIKEFSNGSAKEVYELIFSNPPFYHQYLQNKNNAPRTRAMHTTSLGYEELAAIAYRLLKFTGSFFVIYPSVQMDIFLPLAERAGLYPASFWHIHQKETSARWRVAAEFKKEKTAPRTEKIIIHDAGGGYHPRYISYLKPFYLKL
ncbi:tRNA1(Val) (adenine(37)-N6)-methyltransferase [Roseivirga sp. BDSF3-8]|uniref:tRNA1(Val) (adenine(37)-N6)-methyltransferase n=1 Tax=Roseivirga sp. BDSF3-8 TaxID=3241598 RepID=UPI0035326BB4